MTSLDLVLGIDSSTQGTAAVVLDRSTFAEVTQIKLAYREDPRLAKYLPANAAVPLLVAREPGEADQPPLMYLAALVALFDDLGAGILRRVAAVNVSAQQHGQVWLTQAGLDAIADLRRPGNYPNPFGTASWQADAFAQPRAPTWMTSSSASEAEEIRQACGGTDAMTRISGSDSPPRFSGAVLRRVALRHPATYARTRRVHLISSFLTAVLCADPDGPIDWGNGAGTSLMHWGRRQWDPTLAAAVTAGFPDGADGLLARLPRLDHPLAIVGAVAPALAHRFGFSPTCQVVAGSGDNPQTKVLSSGDLLSLGTSFVLMTAGDAPHPAANAMYDGLGRPFLFGCRTNGALAWEAVRRLHGRSADDFAASEQALVAFPVGTASAEFIFQPEVESFPLSPRHIPSPSTDFAHDYAACVDASLALVYLTSRAFSRGGGPVAVAGGAGSSHAVLARVANLWARPAVRLSSAGAGMGAAVAAAVALAPPEKREGVAEQALEKLTRTGEQVTPDAEVALSLRRTGGYFHRLSLAFARIAGTHFAVECGSVAERQPSRPSG